MESWIAYFVINRVLTCLCPYTSKIGGVISIPCLVATFVFIVLTFFFAPLWWYGIIAIAIYLFIPVLIPKIDPNAMGPTSRMLSGVGSIIAEALVVLMYLSLFKVI
jgi:hypothetical protein